jgi:hypothetical protein
MEAPRSTRMALKAVVTTKASSATMHDAADRSARIQAFLAFPLNFIMIISLGV